VLAHEFTPEDISGTLERPCVRKGRGRRSGPA